MKSFCIIGLGRFGMTLARTLAENGREVLVIDNDEKNVEALADTVESAILGDGTSESVLRAAGVSEYDCAVVGMSENVNDSVLAVIELKELGCPYIIARAGSDRHAKVLEKLGVDRIVFPEQDLGMKLGRMLSYRGVHQYIDFSEDTAIAEIEIPKSWEGKTPIELDLRNKLGINVITVRETGSTTGLSVRPKRKFAHGDIVTVIGLQVDVQRLISGDKR